jgi:hypothetical protein
MVAIVVVPKVQMTFETNGQMAMFSMDRCMVCLMGLMAVQQSHIPLVEE